MPPPWAMSVQKERASVLVSAPEHKVKEVGDELAEVAADSEWAQVLQKKYTLACNPRCHYRSWASNHRHIGARSPGTCWPPIRSARRYPLTSSTIIRTGPCSRGCARTRLLAHAEWWPTASAPVLFSFLFSHE
jgi:hypothetical protein